MRREEKERGEAGRTVDDRRVEWSEEGEESRYGRDEGRAEQWKEKGRMTEDKRERAERRGEERRGEGRSGHFCHLSYRGKSCDGDSHNLLLTTATKPLASTS